MVCARLDRRPVKRARLFAAVACCGLAAAGCTMCPDPFDYSGPVPNGSTPQNDFRARSNGILPLGTAPLPWPPVVKDEPRSEGSDLTPVPEAEPAPSLVAEHFAVQQTVAALPEPTGDAEAAAVVDAPTSSVPSPAPSPPWPQGETPGWRARR